MTKVLAGYRVIEHGSFITGPFAAMLLGDLGAEVIKLEHPDGGDPFRGFNASQLSPQFEAYNRNKKSVTVDLKRADDREFALGLLKTADVYIQNFRPGAVDRLGLGASALMSQFPKLVYCSISGFGNDGPSAERPAYDTVAQASSGFLSLFIDPEWPQVFGPVIADPITGLYAAYGILGALVERGQTGRGRLVEVSMLEAMSHFSIEQFHHLQDIGHPPDRIHRARFSQSFSFMCLDKKLIALHLSSPEKFWLGLIKATGAADIGADPRFATRLGRAENYEALQEALRPVFARQIRSVWIERLEKEDVPFAAIYGVDEALQDPQFSHLGIAQDIRYPDGRTVTTIRRPVVFDGQRDNIETAPPPRLGADGAKLRQPTD